MTKRSDPGYKKLFSHPQLIRELLTRFVDADWVHELDFDHADKVNASYIADDLRERADDVVWRIRWGDREVYIYLLIEFQSTVDRFMAVRMLTYIGLLYQDLIKGKQLTPEGCLPPVFAAILYNGDQQWTAAQDLRELIHPVPASLAPFQPDLRYLLLDQSRYPRERLDPVSDVVTALFRLEQGPGRTEASEILGRLEGILDPESELARDLRIFLESILFAELPRDRDEPPLTFKEMGSMLQNTVREWAQPFVDRGRSEGEATLLMTLLESRFGPISDVHRDLIQQANEEQLLAWARKLLGASTAAEVFES